MNSMAYIEREKAKELIKNFGKGAIEDGQKALDPVDDIILLAEAVDLIPAADVAEIRRGEWVKQKRHSSWDCSICGHTVGAYIAGCANYCPNCGAKMDGKDGGE